MPYVCGLCIVATFDLGKTSHDCTWTHRRPICSQIKSELLLFKSLSRPTSKPSSNDKEGWNQPALCFTVQKLPGKITERRSCIKDNTRSCCVWVLSVMFHCHGVSVCLQSSELNPVRRVHSNEKKRTLMTTPKTRQHSVSLSSFYSCLSSSSSSSF